MKPAAMVHVLSEVSEELARASIAHSDFHSYHEGLAVIEEEFLQLRKEVFHDPSCSRSPGMMRIKAITLAAMAVKMVDFIDVHNPPKEGHT